MKIDGILRYEKSVYVPEEQMYLTYTMISEENYDDRMRRSMYSLEIVQSDLKGEERCILADIATSLEMAQRIWQLFTEGLVTPITATDIMEELLSDPFFLYMDE